MRLLFDTNVLVAASVIDHEHKELSLAALEAATHPLVALHSLSELYNTLTKPHGFGYRPAQVMAMVRQFSTSLDILTLSVTQHLAALQRFAELGGVGARLYDFLIGDTARANDVPILVTWNDSHFRPLIEDLKILTPAQYLEYN